MDRTTILGLALGILAVGVAMFYKHIPFMVLLNPAAIFVIFVGTAAAVVNAFPLQDIKKVPVLLKIIFTEQKLASPIATIKLFKDLSGVARREGLLALETRLGEIDDPFLRSGLTLAIDGQTSEFIRDVLNEEISAMEDRHQVGVSIFSQAATYAPTLGVLGAVLGLIAAMGEMNNAELLGAAIAAAFVATVFGIFTGYVIWNPFANKLKRKSSEEIKLKELMIEGILSVLEGQPPTIIEQKLAAYLPVKERVLLAREDETESA